MRPPLVNDSAPYNSHPSLRNMVANFRAIHVIGWLKEVDLTTTIEMWWFAQEQKAAETETRLTQDARRAEIERARAEVTR